MTMLANIHLSKGTGVSNADNLHCEVAEEVDNLQGPWAQAENENEGRDNGTQQLLQDEHLEGRGDRGYKQAAGDSPALITKTPVSL